MFIVTRRRQRLETGSYYQTSTSYDAYALSNLYVVTTPYQILLGIQDLLNDPNVRDPAIRLSPKSARHIMLALVTYSGSTDSIFRLYCYIAVTYSGCTDCIFRLYCYIAVTYSGRIRLYCYSYIAVTYSGCTATLH